MTSNSSVKLASFNPEVTIVSDVEYASGSVPGQIPYVEREPIPFRIWINEEIGRDNPELPMGLLITKKLGRRFKQENIEHVEIAGMKIPVLKTLTAGESIFVKWLEAKVRNNSIKVNSLIIILSKALRAFDLSISHPEGYEPLTVRSSRELVYKIINNEADEVYDSFADAQSSMIEEIIRVSNTSADVNTQNLLKVCFMIAHRVDPDWSMSDCYQMLETESTALVEFWAKEANGGIIPVVAEPEPEPAPVSEEDDLATENKELAQGAGEGKDMTSPGEVPSTN